MNATLRLYLKYPYLVAWHRLTGSYDYYIEDLAKRAEREKAPEDAVYHSTDGDVWVRFADVRNENMRQRVAKYVEEFKRGVQRSQQ